MNHTDLSRTDADLAALRATLADATAKHATTAEPDSASVARTWAAVNRRPTGRERRTRPRLGWVAVPAAAVAVVAVAVTAVTYLRPAPGQTVGAQPPPPPAVTATSTPAPATATDPGTRTRAVPLGQAVNTVATATAAVPAMTLAPGQFVYIRTETTERVDGNLRTRLHELWLGGDLRLARIEVDGTQLPAGDASAEPPSLQYPTIEFLNGLTTDDSALYPMFRDLNAGVKLGGAHYVTKELFYALRTYGPLLPAATRAAFFRVLTHVSGETAAEFQVAGGTYLGFHDLAGSGADLLVDPTTGQVVGERYGTDQLDLWRYAVVGALGERV